MGWPHNERLAGRRKEVQLGQNGHFELQKTFLSEREKIKVELSCPVCVPFVCWDRFRLFLNNYFNISSILNKFSVKVSRGFSVSFDHFQLISFFSYKFLLLCIDDISEQSHHLHIGKISDIFNKGFFGFSSHHIFFCFAIQSTSHHTPNQYKYDPSIFHGLITHIL